MTKKFTLIALMILFFGSMSFGQTATLATVTASPGEAVVVPLNVGSFTNVGAITFKIRINPYILSFSGLSGQAAGFGTATANVTDSTLTIAWYNSSGTTFNGLLCNVNFVYNGAASSPLNFLPSCQVTNNGSPPVPLTITYTNGAVNPSLTNTQTATLENATGTTGSAIPVNLKFAGFSSNVGAITQKIHYDVTKLSFVNISTSGNLNGAMAWASNGTVNIEWTKITGANINWADGNKIILNFVYNGSTPTALEFYPGCSITATSTSNIPVSYFNGGISFSGTASGTATLGSITGAIQGNDYEVPLTFSFPSTSISAFTLYINYDSPRLSYIGPTTIPSNTTIYASGSTITVAYTNISAPSINGLFVNLKFKYNGIGTANVSFGPGCLFTDNLLNTVQVQYNNGTIASASATATAKIGCVQGNPGDAVLVPVNFSLLPTNMGAVTLHIGYDQSKLIFIDAQNKLSSSIQCYLNPATQQIDVVWSSGASPANINGKFLDLRFQYNGGGGGSGAANVYFMDGCELQSLTVTPTTVLAIVPANWNNGGVNIQWKISGYLRYDNTPNPLLPLQNFSIVLKTNPGGATIATTTTNSSGYYEFWALSGSYKLDVTPASGAGWYGDFDDVVTLFDYAFYGTPIPYQTALRLLAGDVAVNGGIDFDDVVAEFDYAFYGVKPPEFTAPEWVFENPVVNVNCADVANMNFFGLNSGDVLGKNPTP